MNRRDFIGVSAAAAASLLLSSSASSAAIPQPAVQPRIPRRRGFNLPGMGGQRARAYAESDFAWMAGWGFDFARLPLSYWSWSSRKDWMRIDEAALKPVDQAVEYGR